MKNKKIAAACLLAAAISVLSGCATTTHATNTEWDAADATKISMSGTSATIDGSGASIQDGAVQITAAGTYVLSGEFKGSVVVSAGGSDAVNLVLNGVDIQGDKNAAIYCTEADRLTITLADGTENTLADTENFTYTEAEAEEPDAALFSKVDMTIDGDGALFVDASFYNGIGTKDDLVIKSGSITVTAANHAIRGRDSVTVDDGTLTLNAGNDGIQSNNDSGEGKGYIVLNGGTYQITAANDAVQAETDLQINGGVFNLVAGGGASAQVADTSGSYKGLKAGGAITVAGGEFTIDSADDAVHAGGDIKIEGGTLAISTGDDGVHSDTSLVIDDGTIVIAQSYEGLEAANITINGGTISINATDDGINVADGTSGEGMGMFGADTFSDSSDRWLQINGGIISVVAQADCIDINGSGEITGGEIRLSGRGGGDSPALDYDGTLTVSGGTLMGAGSAMMAQGISADSSQAGLLVSYSSMQTGGTTIELKNASGNTVLSYAPEQDYQVIVLSSPDLLVGETYTLYTGGAETVSVTLESTSTSISDTGAAVNTMGGGPGGMGGGPGGMGGMRGAGGMGGDFPSDGAMPEDGTFAQGERPDGGETPSGQGRGDITNNAASSQQSS